MNLKHVDRSTQNKAGSNNDLIQIPALHDRVLNQMKKTRSRSPKKRPNAIQVLRRIANWPANSNSDPDVMGEALEEIQALANRTLLLLAPKKKKPATK